MIDKTKIYSGEKFSVMISIEMAPEDWKYERK